MSAQGIDVGDAVLTFLGDTTQLDAAFDKIGSEATAKMGQATSAVQGTTAAVTELSGEMAVGQNGAVQLGEVVNLAGEKSRESMYQARGEAGLLGEAFGVHLPRHVRSFVAELPGVGEALSAAFTATAVLFLIEALVKLSEKGSEAIATFIYGKEVWEESNKSIIAMNAEAEKLAEEFTKLKKSADDYGKTALQLAQEHQGEVKKSVQDLKQELDGELDTLRKLNKAGFEHMSMWAAFKQGLSGLSGGVTGLASSMALAYSEYKTNNEGLKQLEETQSKVVITAAKLKNAHEELRLATDKTSTAQDELNKKGAALEEQLSLTANTLNNLERAFHRIKAVASEVDIIPSSLVNSVLHLRGELHDLGITLRSDLVEAYKAAEKAEADYVAMGGKDLAILKQLHDVEKQRAKDLADFGQAEDKFKIRSHGLWTQFVADQKAGATALDETKQLGATAFDGLSRGIESAFASVILGTQGIGAALEQATAQALAQIAAQALVKALFYTAEGFASLAHYDGAAATQYFTAAGEMAAVGGAAGLAARGLSGGAGGSGGGSSSSNTHQGNNSLSNAAQQPGQSGVQVVAVQHFATGGLISAPTLSMVGDGGPEAVLPLSDTKAMEQIGAAIAKSGGGGNIHVHVAGHVIGANDVAHLTEQISKRVKKGQATLHASNSLRVTKRSA